MAFSSLHSIETNFISIRVRKDNLMYLFYDAENAFCVDAYAPEVISHALYCEFDRNNYLQEEILKLEKTRKRKLVYALTTHGHFDHAGGNEKLKEMYPETIFVDFTNFHPFTLGMYDVVPIKTPCHTLDSVCFLVKNRDTPVSFVLTGDFLFKLGCGRFFEGSAEMFFNSVRYLFQYIDDETIMLYGHDYYEQNKRFTEQFYKVTGCENFFLKFKEEKEFNPFLNPLRTKIEGKSVTEIIGNLRKLKDDFV